MTTRSLILNSMRSLPTLTVRLARMLLPGVASIPTIRDVVFIVGPLTIASRRQNRFGYPQSFQAFPPSLYRHLASPSSISQYSPPMSTTQRILLIVADTPRAMTCAQSSKAASFPLPPMPPPITQTNFRRPWYSILVRTLCTRNDEIWALVTRTTVTTSGGTVRLPLGVRVRQTL